jgi:hypothetical protein
MGLPDRIGTTVLSSVDTAVDLRWDKARLTAASTTGSVEERVAQVRRVYARELATVGAAAGGTAALPAVGTAGVLATTVAEFGYFTMRIADLILAIAAIHGHTEATVEQRRAWVLSIMAFGDGAASGFTKVAGELGKGLGEKLTRRISAESLMRINKTVGRTIVTKYGTKRGAIALGRALPFGIGAVIGGTANYASARVIASQANRFFAQLPPPLEATSRPRLEAAD